MPVAGMQVLHRWLTRTLLRWGITLLEQLAPTTQQCVIANLKSPTSLQPDLALRASEARYRALIQAVPDLFIHLDRHGTYLQVINGGNLTLVNPEAIKPGKSIFAVLPLALAQQRMHAVQLALTTGQPQSYEYEIEVQGQRLYEEARITPCEDGTVLVIVRNINDRKVAELALQQSEARYRAIVEDQTELICRCLPDTTITFVNDAYCRYFGVQRQAVLGHPFLPLIHLEDQPQVLQQLQALNPSQPVVTSENRERVNGALRWMQWINRGLFDAQGRLTEIQAVGRDITDLKQAEAALKASDARFRQLAEAVREGFFIFETTTAQYSYLNSACRAIAGDPDAATAAAEDYARGMTHWLEKIHPADRDRIEQSLQAERQGQNFSEEYRFLRPDGELRWLHSQAFPIQDETGQVVRIVGTVEDITDRKQAEAALQESEERFRKAFDEAPIGMSLVTTNGQFLKANTRYCQLVGYSEAELQSMTFQAITHPDDLGQDEAGMHQMLAGHRPTFEMEKRYITKQGTVIPVLMKTAPIRDASGQTLYCVGHIQDLRERLKVERMKDEFISVVSHELRTPLTSIRGALGILESDVFKDRPDKAQHMLKIALSNSDRLVRLVNDILDLERLQSGKVPLVLQTCPVPELVQQALQSVQPIADEATIPLTCTSLPQTIQADPDAIVQALVNLLSNAIKFSPPSSPVELRVDEVPDALRFAVGDRGRGIPPDKLEVIFEAFQQVDISDARRRGGTGLGLAICKNIVQQHGGTIWVESTLGAGSTFYFTVPRLAPLPDHRQEANQGCLNGF